MPEMILNDKLWNCSDYRMPPLVVTDKTTTQEILSHDHQTYEWGAACDMQILQNRKMLRDIFEQRNKEKQ